MSSLKKCYENISNLSFFLYFSLFFSIFSPGIPDHPRTRPDRSPMLPKLGINSSSRDTPNVKKRHRRAKSGALKNTGPGDGDG